MQRVQSRALLETPGGYGNRLGEGHGWVAGS